MSETSLSSQPGGRVVPSTSMYPPSAPSSLSRRWRAALLPMPGKAPADADLRAAPRAHRTVTARHYYMAAALVGGSGEGTGSKNHVVLGEEVLRANRPTVELAPLRRVLFAGLGVSGGVGRVAQHAPEHQLRHKLVEPAPTVAGAMPTRWSEGESARARERERKKRCNPGRTQGRTWSSMREGKATCSNASDKQKEADTKRPHTTAATLHATFRSMPNRVRGGARREGGGRTVRSRGSLGCHAAARTLIFWFLAPNRLHVHAG